MADDRLKSIVSAVINAVMRRVDYHALYAGRVVAQTLAGSVAVIPDSPRIPHLIGVKIRHGLPGFTCEVPLGARVLVGFEDGDPSKPYVALWDAGSVTSVTYDGGTRAVARVNDTVGCGTVTGTTPSGAVTFTYTPQGGGTPVVSTTLTIAGTITSGNTKFKA